MWRHIAALVLLPALAAAQAAQTQPSPPVETKQQSLGQLSPSKPAYRPYTLYNAIRRGRDEDVAIQLSPVGFVTSPRSPVSGIVPLNLELQPAEGLASSKLRYPKAHKRKFKFQRQPLPVAGPPVIRFKVHADQNAVLGMHVLTGKLTFQPIHFDTGLGPVQQVDVAIPISVVEHHAKVSKAGWPLPYTPAGVWIAVILLLPVFIVLLPIYLICVWATPNRCPD